MQDTLTITINPELKAALLEIAQAEGISPDSFMKLFLDTNVLIQKILSR
ncbi:MULTISPECIES: hypothetical protein [Aphanizomenonaceae]|uniref:Uncharacterized protein n=1 Tax=Dolichospermum heterosporum TAC447 TaxID=747523 RepID=A0ABY5M0T3_9CYAN|nr:MULTISPECIES: hypothetical protein [Aphanizomenonaceae]UUO16453.1 hypothetical protein NG743_05265 [Dolichospermum heterosporum TAC447]